MTSLGELREALDKIDNEIAELYEKRMEVCRKVGEYKAKNTKGRLPGCAPKTPLCRNTRKRHIGNCAEYVMNKRLSEKSK